MRLKRERGKNIVRSVRHYDSLHSSPASPAYAGEKSSSRRVHKIFWSGRRFISFHHRGRKSELPMRSGRPTYLSFLFL